MFNFLLHFSLKTSNSYHSYGFLSNRNRTEKCRKKKVSYLFGPLTIVCEYTLSLPWYISISAMPLSCKNAKALHQSGSKPQPVNPTPGITRVCLCKLHTAFYWTKQTKQTHVKGKVEKATLNYLLRYILRPRMHHGGSDQCELP